MKNSARCRLRYGGRGWRGGSSRWKHCVPRWQRSTRLHNSAIAAPWQIRRSTSRRATKPRHRQTFIPEMLQPLDEELASAAGRQQQQRTPHSPPTQHDLNGIPMWVHNQAAEWEERQQRETSSDIINNLDIIDEMVRKHTGRRRVEEEDSLDRWLNSGSQEEAAVTSDACRWAEIERPLASLTAPPPRPVSPIHDVVRVPQSLARVSEPVRRAPPVVAPITGALAVASASSPMRRAWVGAIDHK